MADALRVLITIDNELDLTTTMLLDKGSSILDVRKRLVSDDTTGQTKFNDVALSLPKNDCTPAFALPDSTVLLSGIHSSLDLCEPSPFWFFPVDDLALEAAVSISPPSWLAVPPTLVSTTISTSNLAVVPSGTAIKPTSRQEVTKARNSNGEGRLVMKARDVPSCQGMPVTEDTGETKVKGVSRDGRFVFAYVGSLEHPNDLIAIIPFSKGQALNADWRANCARYVYAGGTLSPATSVTVQSEVVVDVTGLTPGQYELASFAHSEGRHGNYKRQLNKQCHLQNCINICADKGAQMAAANKA